MRSEVLLNPAMRSTTRCLHILILGAVLGSNVVPAQTRSTNPHTVSVCDLFKDLPSHAGEMVSVRGMLYTGDEIYALGAHCDSRFVTKYNWAPVLLGVHEVPTGEYVWPTALDLKYSTFDQSGEKPASYQTDHEALHQVNLVIEKELAKLGTPDKREIWVTVLGTLRIKEHYDVSRRPDGTLMGGGYGHLSAYPGQLVIKTMFDPLVKSNKQ